MNFDRHGKASPSKERARKYSDGETDGIRIDSVLIGIDSSILRYSLPSSVSQSSLETREPSGLYDIKSLDSHIWIFLLLFRNSTLTIVIKSKEERRTFERFASGRRKNIFSPHNSSATFLRAQEGMTVETRKEL